MVFPPLAVLAHVERRRLLSELSKSDESVTVSGVDYPLLGEGTESEILDDILYFHIPKMVEHGYVRFDREEGTVTRGPRFDAI